MTSGRDPQYHALTLEEEHWCERRVASQNNIAGLLFGKEKWE